MFPHGNFLFHAVLPRRRSSPPEENALLVVAGAVPRRKRPWPSPPPPPPILKSPDQRAAQASMPCPAMLPSCRSARLRTTATVAQASVLPYAAAPHRHGSNRAACRRCSLFPFLHCQRHHRRRPHAAGPSPSSSAHPCAEHAAMPGPSLLDRLPSRQSLPPRCRCRRNPSELEKIPVLKIVVCRSTMATFLHLSAPFFHCYRPPKSPGSCCLPLPVPCRILSLPTLPSLDQDLVGAVPVPVPCYLLSALSKLSASPPLLFPWKTSQEMR